MTYDNEMPRMVAAITVDDCLLGGKPEDIKYLTQKVEKHIKISIETSWNVIWVSTTNFYAIM